jgi:hypothetical protein
MDAPVHVLLGYNSAMTTTIETDLHCTACGYNLRTLGVDAVCPECGAAVSKSIPGDDTPWRITVRRGLSLCIFSLATGSVFYGVMYLLVVYTSHRSSVDSMWGTILYFTFGGAIMLLHFWSLWMIGTPPTPSRGPAAYRRQWLRLSAAIYISCYFVMMAQIFMRGFSGSIWIQAVFDFTETAFFVLRGWMLWTCIAYVLSSIDNQRGATVAKFIRGFTLGFNIYFLFNIIQNLVFMITFTGAWGSREEQWLDVMRWIGLIAGLGIVGVGIWGFAYLIIARQRLAKVEPGRFGADLTFYLDVIREKLGGTKRAIVENAGYHGAAPLPPSPEEEKKS